MASFHDREDGDTNLEYGSDSNALPLARRVKVTNQESILKRRGLDTLRKGAGRWVLASTRGEEAEEGEAKETS
jgi:hypothetical protein